MLKASDWATERCEIHDMVSCADCLDRAKLRRTATGEIRYSDDCGIATLSEVTGLDYEFCSEVMREAGGRPGTGTDFREMKAAFASLGCEVVELTRMISLEDAVLFSRGSGRKFFAGGWTASQGHAWTIKDGQQLRHFFAGHRFSYRLFEVSV